MPVMPAAPWLFRILVPFSVLVATTGTAEAASPACDGGILELRPGSTIDYGWTGIAHDNDSGTGPSFGFAVQRRCLDDSSPCYSDDDCGDSECVRTCDCVSDTTCEVTDLVGNRRCLRELTACTTDDDCQPGLNDCASLAGPPMPQSSGGTPICIVSSFDAPLTGTVDTATGEMDLASTLRWRVSLGIAIDKPCPRCGAPAQEPRVGDVFVCDGGLRHGQACTVDGVTGEFGGTSYDCPPDYGSSIMGAGITIPLSSLSTGTVARTAQLPCKFFGFAGNPLNPGSNPKCTDKRAPDDPVCDSNADCRRCTGDVSIACTSDDDCTGSGTCAEAPDQPVTCGFWCHCGFCNGNASRPCFENGDCGEGEVCQQGTGTGTQANAPQQRPNDCSLDQFLCSGEDETCATSTIGSCTDKPYYWCSSNADCESLGAGACEIRPKPCYGPRIRREGSPSPLGVYCAASGEPCSTNADCEDETDHCAQDVMSPDLSALFCVPATGSSTINSAGGITGPGTLHWETLIRMCRCDVYAPECEAFCDSLDPCGPDDDGKPCDDGIFCNGTDTCNAGICVKATAPACDPPGDDDQDCSEACNEATKSCTGDDPDGSLCTDHWPCTVEDLCLGGTCVLGNIDGACACGDWTGDGAKTATDAQGILRVAVGLHQCAPWICDYNGSGTTTTSDALAVLRASVGQPSDPACPEAD